MEKEIAITEDLLKKFKKARVYKDNVIPYIKQKQKKNNIFQNQSQESKHNINGYLQMRRIFNNMRWRINNRIQFTNRRLAQKALP